MPPRVAKARPPAFHEPSARLLGHEHARDVLARAVIEDRPAQSYVFSGPEGVGKHACGLWLARLLLCTSRAADSHEPCYECNACRKITSSSHPDVVELGLLDKATIGVDRVRDMQQSGRFAPLEGDWKIFLLTDAHRLTEQAMNCLLKTLEEPQAQQIYVLMTPTHGALLPTILSRCQLLRFAPLQAPRVADWLRALDIDAARAEQASVLSEGRPGMALRMVRDTKLWDFRQRVLQHAAAIANGDPSALMDIAEKLEGEGGSDKRLAAERTLEMLTTWYRDVMWLQRGLDPARLLNADFREALDEAARRYTLQRAMHALAALREAREQLAHNVNARLMYMRLVIHLKPR